MPFPRLLLVSPQRCRPPRSYQTCFVFRTDASAPCARAGHSSVGPRSRGRHYRRCRPAQVRCQTIAHGVNSQDCQQHGHVVYIPRCPRADFRDELPCCRARLAGKASRRRVELRSTRQRTRGKGPLNEVTRPCFMRWLQLILSDEAVSCNPSNITCRVRFCMHVRAPCHP